MATGAYPDSGNAAGGSVRARKRTQAGLEYPGIVTSDLLGGCHKLEARIFATSGRWGAGT